MSKIQRRVIPGPMFSGTWQVEERRLNGIDAFEAVSIGHKTRESAKAAMNKMDPNKDSEFVVEANDEANDA